MLEDEELKLNKRQHQDKFAEQEETLSISLTKNVILAKTSNIAKLTVNYFLINLEVLFSRNPFLSNDSSDFGYVKPNC